MSDNSNLNEVSSELGKALMSNNFDIITDYSEIALDSIFDSKIVDEVPVIKTIAALCKTGMAIRDRHFAKKILIFLREFQDGTVEESRKNKFLMDLDDVKYKSRVIDTILVYLDKFSEQKKAPILTKILQAHINGKFGWEKVILFANCLEILFLGDIEVLKRIYENADMEAKSDSELFKDYKPELNRLAFLGFIVADHMQSTTWTETPSPITYSIISDGLMFYECIK